MTGLYFIEKENEHSDDLYGATAKKLGNNFVPKILTEPRRRSLPSRSSDIFNGKKTVEKSAKATEEVKESTAVVKTVEKKGKIAEKVEKPKRKAPETKVAKVAEKKVTKTTEAKVVAKTAEKKTTTAADVKVAEVAGKVADQTVTNAVADKSKQKATSPVKATSDELSPRLRQVTIDENPTYSPRRTTITGRPSLSGGLLNDDGTMAVMEWSFNVLVGVGRVAY